MLAVLLLLTLVAGASAAAETVVFHQENEPIRALWVRDGALYLMGWGSYYVYADGTLETYDFRPALEDGESLLAVAAGDDAVWALAGGADGVRAGRLTLNGDDVSMEPGAAVDWPADDISDVSPFVLGDYLAFLSLSEGAVAVCALSTGDVDVYDSDANGYLISACAACPYGDAGALVAARGSDGIDVLTIDFRTGEVAAAFSLPVQDTYSFGALLWDAATDSVSYVLDGALCRVTGFDAGTAEILADASSFDASWGLPAARMDDGAIVLAGWGTAVAYGPDFETTASLSVAANLDDLMNDTYYAYLEAHPDAQVTISNAMFAPGDVSQLILTQSTQYDIYVTCLNWADYDALYEKGYLADLSDSEALAAFADSLYPAIQEAVEKDGALVAVPIRLDLNLPAYNPTAFAALGLTEEDVPETWPEFLALLQRLPGILAGTDYTAFDPTFPLEDWAYLYDDFLRDYMLYLEHEPSAGMLFDTEMLRTLFEEYAKIDFSALGQTVEGDDGLDYEDLERHTLFSMGAYAACEAETTEYLQFMPLSLADGMEKSVRAELSVAIVNPYSENKAAATDFLEAAVERMPEVIRAGMTPGWTEPIKTEDIDEDLAMHEERIAALQEEVESATGDEKAQYQEMLDGWTESYARAQERYWNVTAEELAAYRTYADSMGIWHNLGLGMAGEGELYGEVDRFLDGAVDADTMLRNIDQKINMMLLEDQ